MPPEYDVSSTAFQQCANCGDLRPTGAQLCPHCGASTAPGSRTATAGLAVGRIVLAILVGLLVVPLAAAGACFLILAPCAKDSGLTAIGALLIVLAGLGFWGMARLLSKSNHGSIRR
jgi:hypothetical protein